MIARIKKIVANIPYMEEKIIILEPTRWPLLLQVQICYFVNKGGASLSAKQCLQLQILEKKIAGSEFKTELLRRREIIATLDVKVLWKTFLTKKFLATPSISF